MSLEPTKFREVMSRFATGVTIVTTRTDEGIHGLTVNAFTSVSLSPPLILVCIDSSGTSMSYLAKADVFAVNILGHGQQALANRFADSSLTSEQRFQEVGYSKAVTGAPILEHSLGYLDCRVYQRHEAGDHTIFVGEVVDAGLVHDEAPLIFYRSSYRELK
jgi:flavin reductase (DIM6/NTAB) family NADH-FMN oxidoreductase RutF